MALSKKKVEELERHFEDCESMIKALYTESLKDGKVALVEEFKKKEEKYFN